MNRKEKIKVGHFQMGNADIAFDPAIESIGFEVVKTPKPSANSIQFGVANSPEYACFPFKTFLGTYKECVELGAHVLFTIGGKSVNACHLEDYAHIHEKTLHDQGYDVKIIDFASGKPKDMLATLQKLNPNITLKMVFRALSILTINLNLVSDVEEKYANLLVHCPNNANKYLEKYLHKIRKQDRLIEAYKIRKAYTQEYLKLISRSKIKHKPLRVAIVGDIYSVNEPAMNSNIVVRLGELGVVSKKTITLANVANNSLPIGKYSPARNLLIQKSKKYMSRHVGGFSRDTIMASIKSAEDGYDGIIHIYPFTCAPEAVVRSILPRISEDFKIPILYLPMDEQTGEAGTQTRLEAFVDLLKLQKKKHRRWF